MTRTEWLEIGYSKNIIEQEDFEEITFASAFREWFIMKQKCIKSQSLDRIEVTYNRYYKDTDFTERHISKISDTDIINFLLSSILQNGTMTYKELSRLLQVVRGTLVYMRDIGKGGAILHDWEKIKRSLPTEKLESGFKQEFAVNINDVEKIMDCVINHRIYKTKQSASLLLCMNFYLGLRIGELASLTFHDFDFDRNVVKIYKTESKFYNRDENGERFGTMVYRVVDDLKTVYSVREVPLLPEVKQIYNLIVAHHIQYKYESPYLGYDGADTIIVRSLDRTLRKLCLLCDVPYFNSHAIRKTFATMLHFNGVPTRVISDLMGHSEIGTTENSYILSYKNNYDRMFNYMHDSLKYNLVMQ